MITKESKHMSVYIFEEELEKIIRYSPEANHVQSRKYQNKYARLFKAPWSDIFIKQNSVKFNNTFVMSIK